MAQVPPNHQRFYNPHNHHATFHHHNAPPPPPASSQQPQLQPQFRNPFLLFDGRAGAINYNYIRPYMPPGHLGKSDEISESLVMRRPRRTRTTFTSAQITELEQHFLQSRYLTASRLAELAAKLSLGTAQVKIWFKNRRRRQKIQMDQQRENGESCVVPALSPSLDLPLKTELKFEHKRSASSPNQQCLLSFTNGVSPVLTPSPTPTTPNPANNAVEQYHDAYSSYQNYTTNCQQNVNLSMTRPPMHYQIRNAAKVKIENQYCVNPPNAYGASSSTSSSPPNDHDLPIYQQVSGHHAYHRQVAPRQFGEFNSQPFFDYQRKAHENPMAPFPGYVASKTNPDMNFNNPFYMHPPPSNMAIEKQNQPLALDVNNQTGNTLESALPPLERTLESSDSPNSILYEPLTPKNDDSPSLSSNKNVRAQANCGNSSNSIVKRFEQHIEVDAMQRSDAKPLIGLEDACRSENSIGNNNSKMPPIQHNGGDAYAKYTKITGEYQETNYQCTMDTLMHSYMTHHHHHHRQHQSPGNNPQFAYCFN